MANKKIRLIATSFKGDAVALGEFESRVCVYDVKNRKKTAELETVFDFGGRRLSISADGTKLITGAYHIYGLVLYDVNKKLVLWQRKDLKKIQKIKFSLDDKYIMAFFEDKAAHFLNIQTGNTFKKIRGVQNIYESPFASFILVDKSNLQIRDIKTEKLVSKIPRTTFAVLDAVFTPEIIALTESGGPLSVYSISDGKLLWRYPPKKGRHILRVGYNALKKNILGIEWPYEKGGDKILLTFGEQSGDILNHYTLKNCPAETEFMKQCTLLITSEGEIIDTSNNSLVDTFDWENI